MDGGSDKVFPNDISHEGRIAPTMDVFTPFYVYVSSSQDLGVWLAYAIPGLAQHRRS